MSSAGRLTGLHHVQLAAPPGSEAALRRFYGSVLGMDEVAKPAALAARGGAWFRSGSLELHLGIEPDFRPARKAHPGILVADLDAVVARLAHHGVEVEWDEQLPGFRRCYVTDPHGNRLELLEPLP
jgi:catechol 2,3-dioxygenase-like lactoylglutathione lyase family enzyme